MAEMDIAVVGLAFKLPQGVEDVSSLWETLEKRKNLMTEWPESRANLKAFYHEDKVNRVRALLNNSTALYAHRDIALQPWGAFYRSRPCGIRCSILFGHGQGGHCDGPNAEMDTRDIVQGIREW